VSVGLLFKKLGQSDVAAGDVITTTGFYLAQTILGHPGPSWAHAEDVVAQHYSRALANCAPR
jgi:hypothetical protein